MVAEVRMKYKVSNQSRLRDDVVVLGKLYSAF